MNEEAFRLADSPSRKFYCMSADKKLNSEDVSRWAAMVCGTT
jgi:hypothetical protein